jgi:Tol biopolymer transport system component
MQNWGRLIAIAALTCGALIGAPPAHGAYPGENGKIVVASGPETLPLYTANPDGSGIQQLTSGPDQDPVWSPDGERVAFVHGSSTSCPCMYSIHAVNADGTGDTQITPPTPDFLETPTWSPDGARIAFSRWDGSNYQIWVVDVDGSDLTQVTNTPFVKVNLSWSPRGDRIAFDDFTQVYSIRPDGSDLQTLITVANSPDPPGGTAYAAINPDWSPDGARLLYQLVYECDGDTCGDIRIRNLEGTGDTLVVSEASGFGPWPLASWAPDATRIVVQGFTIAPDGTGFAPGPGGYDADWQPLPVETTGSHIRPKTATPFRVPLVPAAKPCTTPNREHGPPLAFGSCNPPQPGSSYLTAGVGDGSPALARSTGSVRMDVQLGAPGAPEDSDVAIRFSLTNVMRASDLSEYTGELRTELSVRRTDRDGLGFAPHSTSMDFPFGFTVPCSPTPGSSLDASSCVSFTSANAVVPLAVKDTNRAVWGLDKLRVYDGGPDEDGDTEADNSLFMTQGVFVP